MSEASIPELGESAVSPDHSPVLTHALERLGSYLEHARQDPEQGVLYDEQVPVMEDLHRFLGHYGSELRGRIVVPTGVGKTVLFTEFVRATGLRTLVLTPTTLLLQQTEAAFGRFAGDDDVAVGKVYGGEKNGNEPITVTTYASFVKHTKDKDSPYIKPDDYDLIIMDEAHRALAGATQTALKEYPSAVQIGFTATETYSERRKLDSVLPHEIHKMTIQEAVTSRLISPFSVWTVETETDMSSVKIRQNNEYDQEDLQKTINTQARNEVAVELYAKHFDKKKVIFACSGVAHAKDMAELLRQNGIAAEAIHGGLTINQQRALKERFADSDPSTGLLVLCNDKILAEGFDEPSIVAGFNLAPTLSYVRSQQRGGRPLRLDPNNPEKHAIIVEFVDKNYRKPPVLFADAKIAGTAHMGAQLDFRQFEETFQFNLASARVTTNPELVEQQAVAFSEARKDQRPIAPEDWLTISGLTKQMNLSASAIQQALKTMREHVPDFLEENTGRYLSAGVRDGITTYYSPAIIEGLDILVQRPEVAPEGWLTVNQIASRYDIARSLAYRHLNEIGKEGSAYAGSYVEGGGRATKKQFYSPDSVKKLADHLDLKFQDGTAPPHWVDEGELAAQFGTNAHTLALGLIEKRAREVIINDTATFGETLYVSPRVVKELSKLVTPGKDWANLAEIATKLDVGEDVVTTVIGELEEKYKRDYGVDFRLCWVNGQEITYYKPAFFMLVKRAVAEYQSNENAGVVQSQGDSEPITLVEDEVVLVPHFERSVVERVEHDPLGRIVFEEVIKLPAARSNRGRMRAVSPSRVSPRKETQPIPTSPKPNAADSPYLNAFKRFGKK